MKNQVQKRQGDLFFQTVASPPQTAVKKKTDAILAYGEVTGHSHKIMTPSMDQMDSVVDESGDIYCRCMTQDVTIGHDEHDAITMPQGEWFCVSRQKEYDPLSEERRIVAD